MRSIACPRIPLAIPFRGAHRPHSFLAGLALGMTVLVGTLGATTVRELPRDPSPTPQEATIRLHEELQWTYHTHCLSRVLGLPAPTPHLEKACVVLELLLDGLLLQVEVRDVCHQLPNCAPVPGGRLPWTERGD